MGFVGPKLVWLLLSPGNLIGLSALLGLLLLASPWRRLGRWLLAAMAVVIVLLTLLPVGTWLLFPLEMRFPRPAMPLEADSYAGIVVLGGAVQPGQTATHGHPSLGEPAERMTEAVALARRHPTLPLVFTGGDASLHGSRMTEAAVARMLFTQLGLADDRVRYESGARNTWENATLTLAQVKPSGDKPWLLVTSAAHMPRSIGSFRRAGWNVVAYPVDYVTTIKVDRLSIDFAGNLYVLSRATREWLALVFYYVAGRTDALLPAPQQG